MVNKDYRHKKKSVCEVSMLLVANIIRMSSLSFSGLSFTMNLPRLQGERNRVSPVSKGNTNSAPKIPNKSERSQKPELTKKPRSYLMKPEKEGATFVRQELNDIDVIAENYISQIHGKIGKDASEAATTATVAAGQCFSAIPSSSSIAR